MGSSKHIHIGAFGAIINPATKTVEIHCPPCAKCGKGVKAGEYCSQCGNIGTSKFKQSKMNFYDMKPDDLEECSLINDTGPGHSLFSSNINGCGTELNDPEPFTEITQAEIETCITNFKDKFKRTISEVEKHCERVDIKFGVVEYWS